MCFLSGSGLSFSVRLLANYTSPVLHPIPLFFSSHSFALLLFKALLSPDRFAGDKTWSLGEETDIWEQDGERDGGHVPTHSHPPGSMETLAARRWVPFTACVQHPAVQHLWIGCHSQLVWKCWQGERRDILFSSLVAECIFYNMSL